MSPPSSQVCLVTWLITGSSRSIGFEINATALHGLKSAAKGTLHINQLDVSDFNSARAFSEVLRPILGYTGCEFLQHTLACIRYHQKLILCSLQAPRDQSFTMDPEDLLRAVRTNVAGPALLSQIGRKKTILHLSSTVGSISSAGDNVKINASYTISKAALNMLCHDTLRAVLTVLAAAGPVQATKQKFERPDFAVIALCLEWVKIDMGGAEASLEPEDSVAGILKVVTSNATPADSGKFLRYNGEEIPW
ncbi:hypothetical protein C8Q79DRAFT_929831 [Trametes meyenii]|nr:hypothetical protein C8Q79DRAFT_929831 [Trametes meyenii]